MEEEEGEISELEQENKEEEDDLKPEKMTPPITPLSTSTSPPEGFGYETEDEGHGEEGERSKFEEDLNITDSQVMIQLKEAEEEAEALRKEIAKLRAEVEDYQCRETLSEADDEHLQEVQLLLLEKIAQLDELTKRIAKLMEMAGRTGKSEDTTILDEEEEEEGFPDDLLPRVVICSSWDDMMPKVVVCMDMKKPGVAKKKAEDDRDENGLSPEQREALEQERRCMAEERNRLQYQIACMEGEMRVMMRENDMLSRKVAQLKQDIENQPPFEFEMSVSATNPPGCGAPKPGNMDMGYGLMGPDAKGAYTMGGSLAPGAEVQGKMAIQPPYPQFPPGMCPTMCGGQGYPQPQAAPQNCTNGGRVSGGGRNLPCGGMNGSPGKSVPCPQLQPQNQTSNQPNPNDWSTMLPPYGKKCRKDFNAAQSSGCCGGGGGCCGGSGSTGMPGMHGGMPMGFMDQPPFMIKQPPMDVNFKVNVQPQNGPCEPKGPFDTDTRSNKIAQQLQEIEAELRRMQKDLCKAKHDKDTLKAQQATLDCAKNFIS